MVCNSVSIAIVIVPRVARTGRGRGGSGEGCPTLTFTKGVRCQEGLRCVGALVNDEMWLLAPRGAIADAEQHELHFNSSTLSVVRSFQFQVHSQRSIRIGMIIGGWPGCTVCSSDLLGEVRKG